MNVLNEYAISEFSSTAGADAPADLSTPRAEETPPKITVYAMRVQAPLFGHNAQKRTRLVQTPKPNPERVSASLESPPHLIDTTTEEIGEWPIACMSNNKPSSTESVAAIFLDAVYKNILPGSYVVLDMQAVPPPLEGQRDAAAVAAVAAVRAVLTEENFRCAS